MDDLPIPRIPPEHESSTMDESGSIIEMEADDREFAISLDPQMAWLDVHVGGAALPARICSKTILKLFSNSVRPVARSANPRG